MPDAREYLRPDGSCPFGDRFGTMGDASAKARVDTAVRKLERGLRPDVKPVGQGVHEARIDFGPGYRVYFGIDGTDLIILLLCGDKKTQARDIVFCHSLWHEYRSTKLPSPPQS